MLLLLTFILAVRLCGAATVVPECTTESSSAVRSLSAGVDALRAEQSQRQHLEALFNRYGENGSISLAGLKLLLQNVGLDRNRSVTTSEVSKDQDSLQDRKGVSSAVFSAQMMVKSDENQETNGTPEDHDHDQINRNIPHNHSEDSVECLNASTILSSHGMSSGGSVSFADFSFLCPALLHQIDDGALVIVTVVVVTVVVVIVTVVVVTVVVVIVTVVVLVTVVVVTVVVVTVVGTVVVVIVVGNVVVVIVTVVVVTVVVVIVTVVVVTVVVVTVVVVIVTVVVTVVVVIVTVVVVTVVGNVVVVIVTVVVVTVVTVVVVIVTVVVVTVVVVIVTVVVVTVVVVIVTVVVTVVVVTVVVVTVVVVKVTVVTVVVVIVTVVVVTVVVATNMLFMFTFTTGTKTPRSRRTNPEEKSLLSLLGVILIPLMNKVFFKFLLSFLVALAVGTLSGDAFLHLIPHSQGGHHHHEDSGMNVSGHDHHEEENLDGVWKGLTALSGVYIMFLIEHFLTLGKMYKDKKQKVQKKWDQNDKADPEKQPALEDLKPAEEVETNGAAMFGAPSLALRGGSEAEEQQVMLEPEVSIVSAPEESVDYTAEDCENKCHSHFHDTAGVAALAWMVIMGDGLHNFSDGLAIGAAFTEGLSSGLSTSVAVFCHELPHELGDFAVLLKAGMTVRQAILYNGLSALMAYLGVVIGILIGHYAENVSMWVFALTAGLFLYVALVDMVPEMLHNDAGDHGFSHCGFFLLQNAGILLGFCIMLLIAVFEHKIQLDLGY
ncbi:Zinc transporter ZIP6 [Dissostichus eleginoides]|uniref:Zinc transporter ZIP6 n=1 Tax=Dissostichus eleginoides TaxID=100907 RepID=A0AAD9B9K7_DISEL|nr:Zinc transporter ZIP6 [Dissostichus eleginoides]